MASAETKQKESNMKRCKITRAETKATMPKKLITSLGFFPITSVEINEDSSIQFYINLDSSVIDYECRDTCILRQSVATGAFASGHLALRVAGS